MNNDDNNKHDIDGFTNTHNIDIDLIILRLHIQYCKVMLYICIQCNIILTYSVISLSLSLHIYIYIIMWIHIHIYIYVYIYTYIYIYIYDKNIYIYMYMYTHINTPLTIT